MSKVWAIPELSPNQKLVFLAICDNANDEGICYPSIDTLQAKTSISRPTIIKLIKELEETRKYTYPDVAGGKESDKSFMSQGTTNQLPQGNASPVGTHKNKIINPRGMKAGNGK